MEQSCRTLALGKRLPVRIDFPFACSTIQDFPAVTRPLRLKYMPVGS